MSLIFSFSEMANKSDNKSRRWRAMSSTIVPDWQCKSDSLMSRNIFCKISFTSLTLIRLQEQNQQKSIFASKSKSSALLLKKRVVRGGGGIILKKKAAKIMARGAPPIFTSTFYSRLNGNPICWFKLVENIKFFVP